MNETPPGLFAKVMSRIYEEREKAAFRWRFAASSLALGALTILLVPAGLAFARELEVTGFSRFLSMAFTDFGSVLAVWKDYGLTLLESFPAVYAAALLLDAAAVMIAVKFAVKYSHGFRRLDFSKS